MKPCPKCGMIINNDSKECPKCHTNFIQEDIEILELPMTKEEKNKKDLSLPAKKKDSKKSSKEIAENEKKEKKVSKKELKSAAKKEAVIKSIKAEKFIPPQIPLTIKKTNNNKKKNEIFDDDIENYINEQHSYLNNYYKDDETLFNISSLIKVFTVVLLFIFTIMIIINIVSDKEQKPATVIPNKVVKTELILFDEWITDNDSLFVFKNDLSFYWYESSKNKEDNYYAGTYTYKTGHDALIEMGYDEAEFIKTFGSDMAIENVYSLEMTPTISYINKKDVSTSNIAKNTKWWYILIIKKDGTAISYNKSLDIRYNLYNKNITNS